MSRELPSGEEPVLAAIDFSKESKLALLWAARQAKLENAALVVLHVVHDPAESPGSYAEPDQNVPSPMFTVAEKKLEEFLSQAKADHPELSPLSSAHTRLVSGLPSGRIVEIAEEINARIVVIGNIGRSTFETILLGSVAERVVRYCKAPVAVIKAPAGAGVG